MVKRHYNYNYIITCNVAVCSSLLFSVMYINMHFAVIFLRQARVSAQETQAQVLWQHSSDHRVLVLRTCARLFGRWDVKLVS